MRVKYFCGHQKTFEIRASLLNKYIEQIEICFTIYFICVLRVQSKSSASLVKVKQMMNFCDDLVQSWSCHQIRNDETQTTDRALSCR